jgi:flagellar biosynthetic protein FliQ
MTPDQTTEMFRYVLREALLIAAPVIIAASVTSLVVSLLQTLTSIQDQTLSIVPRLLVTGIVLMLGMPWFLRQLRFITESLFQNLGKFIDH